FPTIRLCVWRRFGPSVLRFIPRSRAYFMAWHPWRKRRRLFPRAFVAVARGRRPGQVLKGRASVLGGILPAAWFRCLGSGPGGRGVCCVGHHARKAAGLSTKVFWGGVACSL